MKLLLMAGHGAGDPGAVSGGRQEAVETRRVAASLAASLAGACDVTLYPTDRNGYSDYKAGSLQKTARFAQYDALVELHFNACAYDGGDGVPKGTECYVTTTAADTALASAFCKKLAALGFPNRGVKRYNWAVISAASRQGISACLLELCFLDDGDDMALYDDRYDEIVDALAQAVMETYGLEKEEPMTYEEFTAMIRRYEEERASKSADQWSAPAREWAEANRLINDGRYKSHVTREELAQVLYNLLATV